MENTTKRPRLTLHIEAPNKHFSWCIAKDGKVIHHIDNIKTFSKQIGYPDVNPSIINHEGEISSKVISADHHDFISNSCTQIRIATYLVAQGEMKRLELGEYYVDLLELCRKQRVTNAAKCSGCFVQKV